jgi:hypothetical protein
MSKWLEQPPLVDRLKMCAQAIRDISYETDDMEAIRRGASASFGMHVSDLQDWKGKSAEIEAENAYVYLDEDAEPQLADRGARFVGSFVIPKLIEVDESIEGISFKRVELGIAFAPDFRHPEPDFLVLADRIVVLASDLGSISLAA